MMTHTSSVNLGTNVAYGEEYITSLFSRALYNHDTLHLTTVYSFNLLCPIFMNEPEYLFHGPYFH